MEDKKKKIENKKKICVIAQFPPPMHGLSKAVETLYNSSLISQQFELEKINITNNKKFLENVIKIFKSKADLFYFTNSQTLGGNIRDLIILKLLRFKNKKILVHLHGGYYRKLVENDMQIWQKKANYKAISQINGVIVLGPTLKWIFEGMLPKEKIFIVTNCVDDKYLISNKEFEEKIKKLKDQKVHHILWLSNFIKSKGYSFVLEMAKNEKKRVELGGIKKFHFDFAGEFFDKDDKIYFENYIKDNKLENYITYHGVVLGEKKKQLLKKCIYYILPTQYKKEGQPISILEAMGNGMIILTTNYAGIPDIVQDNVSGFFIDLNKIEALINKILKLKSEEVIKIMEKNRKNVFELYTEKKYIFEVLKIFKTILKEK